MVCVGLLALTTACTGGPVSLDAPALTGSAATACRAFVDALPARVADLARVDADVGQGFGAAFGDPAIEVRCGVRRPAGLTPTSECTTANGIGWYIPEDEQSGPNQGRPTDITMTTVGRAEYVEVQIPADYWPPVNAMVDLGPALKKTVPEMRPCV
ncbi:MAG: DUF3515 domain-containing protein [Nocardioidaceae bacterium]